MMSSTVARLRDTSFHKSSSVHESVLDPIPQQDCEESSPCTPVGNKSNKADFQCDFEQATERKLIYRQKQTPIAPIVQLSKLKAKKSETPIEMSSSK